MYWTLELASKLEDAPWPATKDELIDYAQRSGAPLEVIENLQEMEDEGEIYECIEDIWPDYPSKEDFFFNEEEYWCAESALRERNKGDEVVGFCPATSFVFIQFIYIIYVYIFIESIF